MPARNVPRNDQIEHTQRDPEYFVEHALTRLPTRAFPAGLEPYSGS
jgi:hypothetical protein